MSFAPETQIASSSIDKAAGEYVYVARDGQRRWTVRIRTDVLDTMLAAKRRQYVATALTNAMRGAPDD